LRRLEVEGGVFLLRYWVLGGFADEGLTMTELWLGLSPEDAIGEFLDKW